MLLKEPKIKTEDVQDYHIKMDYIACQMVGMQILLMRAKYLH